MEEAIQLDQRKTIESVLNLKGVHVILSNEHLWRDKKDMFRAISKEGHIVIKIINRNTKEGNKEAALIKKRGELSKEVRNRLGLCKQQMIIEIKQYLVIGFLVKERDVIAMLQAESIKEEKIGLEICLNLLKNIDELRQHDLLIQDQISNFIQAKGNHLIFIPQIIPSISSFKKQVYNQYIKANVDNTFLFPYPPETLSAINQLDSTSISALRGEKAEVWAIASLLFILLGGKTSTLLKLQLKDQRDEGLEEIKSCKYNELFLKFLEIDQNKRLTFQEFKSSLENLLKNYSKEADSIIEESPSPIIALQLEKSYNFAKSFMKLDMKRSLKLLQDCEVQLKEKKSMIIQQQFLTISNLEISNKINKLMSLIEEEKEGKDLIVSTAYQNSVKKYNDLSLDDSKTDKQILNNCENIFNTYKSPKEYLEKFIELLVNKNISPQQRQNLFEFSQNYLNYVISHLKNNYLNQEKQGSISSESLRQQQQQQENQTSNNSDNQINLALSYSQLMYFPTCSVYNKFLNYACKEAEQQGNNIFYSELIQTRILIAMCISEKDDDDDSKAIIEFILQTENCNSRGIIQCAEFLYSINNYNEAKIQVDKLIEMDSMRNDPNLLFFKAKCESQLDNLESAIQSLNRSIEIQPQSDQSHQLLIQLLLKDNQFELALQEMIRCHHSEIQANFELGKKFLEYSSNVQYEETCFRKACELDPNHSQAFYYLGQCLEKQSKFVEAIQQYEQQILNNKDLECYLKIIEVNGKLNRSEGLEKIIGDYLEINHHSLNSYENIITLVSRFSMQQQIMCIYDSYNEQVSSQAEVQSAFHQSKELFQSKSYSDGKDVLIKIQQKYPMSAHLAYQVAIFFLEQGDNQVEDSVIIDLLLMAVYIMPKNLTYSFRLAHFYFSKCNYIAAESQLKPLIVQYNCHPMALFIYGKIQIYTHKNAQVGISYLKKCLKQCPFGFHEIYGALGQAYWKVGKFKKAIAYLQVSIKMEEKQYSEKIIFLYGKSLLLDDEAQKALEVFLNMMKQEKYMKYQHKLIFHIAICQKFLKKNYISFVQSSITKLKDKSPLKAMAIKHYLHYYIQQYDTVKLQKIRLELVDYLSKTNDPDICALFSEYYLLFGYHPLIAIQPIEEGLNRSFDLEIDESESVEETHRKIGCLIISEKINFLNGKVSKALKGILHIKNIIKQFREKQDIAVMTRLQIKELKKQSWTQIDWGFKADLLLAEIYLSMNQIDEAFSLIQFAPQNNKEVQKIQAMILQASKSDKLDEMLQSNNKNNLFLAIIQAKQIFKDKKYIEAREKFTSLIQVLPNSLELVMLLGKLEYEDQNYGECRIICEKYFKLVENQNAMIKEKNDSSQLISYDIEILSQLGHCLNLENNVKGSLKMLKISLQANPDQPTALYWQGKGKISQNKFEEAIMCFQKSLALQENKDAVCQICYCFLKLNQLEEAEIYLIKATLLDEGYFETLKLLGALYLAKMEYSTAKSHYDKALLKCPSDPQILVSTAHCIMEISKNEVEAESYLLKSTQLNPSNQMCLSNYLLFLSKIKKKIDKEFLQKHKPCYQESHVLQFQLGEIFFIDNNIDQAFEFFTSLSNLPFSVQFSSIISICKLRLAQIQYIKKQFINSQNLLRKYLPLKLKKSDSLSEVEKKNQLNFEALLLEGRIRIQLNLPNPSKHLFKCISILPSNSHPYFALAFYFITKRCNSLGSKYLQKGLEIMKIEKQTQSEQSLILQSMQSIQQGNLDEGENYLISCLGKWKNSCQGLFLEGEQMYNYSNYENALNFLLNCKKYLMIPLENINQPFLSNKQIVQCSCYIASSQYHLNQKEQAFATIEECITAYPKFSEIYLVKAVMLFKENKNQECNSLINQFIVLLSNELVIQPLLEKQLAFAYYLSTQAHLRQNNYFSTFSAFDNCIRIDPYYPFIYLKISALFQQICREKKSLEYYQIHLGYYPNSAQGLYGCSKTLISLKKYNKAQIYLDKLYLVLNEEKKILKTEKIQNRNYLAEHYLQIEEDNSSFLDSEIHLHQAHFLQAQINQKSDDIPAAIASFEESLRLNPDSEEILFSLALIYGNIGNRKQEIKLYKQLILIQKSINNKVDYFINLGNAYKAINKINKAIQQYEIAIKQSKEYPINIFTNLANCYIDLNRIDEAQEILNKNLLENKSHKESLYLLSKVYEIKGEIENVTKCLEKVIKIDDFYMEAFLNLAKSKLKENKVSEAINLCKFYLESSPSDTRILYYLGEIYFKYHDYEKSLQQFELCLFQLLKIQKQQRQQDKQYEILNPKNHNEDMIVNCNIFISRNYIQQHKAQIAIKYLEQQLMNSIDNSKYLQELGTIMAHNKKNIPQSLSYFRQAYNATNHTNPYLIYQIADTLHHMKEYNEEISALLECLILKPTFEDQIYNNLGIAYTHIKQPSQAINSLKKGLQVNPSSPQLHLNLGNFQLTSGNLKEAQSSYKTCLLYDESNFFALHNLAIVSVKLKDYERAIECYQKCLAIQPQKKNIYIPKLKDLLRVNIYRNFSDK